MKGEVAAGRKRRRKTVLYFAKRQLEGAVGNDEDQTLKRPSNCLCQKCGRNFYVMQDLDPCAFCDDCKDGVMDMLAEAVVNTAKKKKR